MPGASPQSSRRSYRSLCAAAAGALVLAVGGALGAVQYVQHAISAKRATAVELGQTVRRVDARVRQLLDAAELTAESGARQTLGRTITAADFLPLFRQVVAAFEQRPELTYLGYALEQTGDYALLERRPDSVVFLRTYTGPPGPQRVVRDYRWQAGSFVAIGDKTGDSYDPRRRPHYIAAKAAQRPVWTDIYPFVGRFITDNVDGTTYALPITGADGALTGVWDASLDIRSLTAFLQQLRRETGGTPHLYARRDAQLVSVVNGAEPSSAAGAPTRVQQDSALPPARIDSLLEAQRARARGISGEPALLMDASASGVYIAALAIAEPHLPAWAVAVSLPSAAVDAPLRAHGRILLLVTIAILVGALLLSRVVARQLAQPLEDLGRAADAIARGEPLPPESHDRHTREVAQLRSSFSLMAGAIAAREADLRASRQRLQSHVENTPLGVIEWDQQFRIVSWNAAAEQIFGWTRADMIGQNGSRFVPVEERRAVYEACADMIVTGHPARHFFDHVTRDGRRIQCEWYGTPTKDESGRISGITTLVLDVSQRLGAEAAFRQAEERFDRLFRAAPAGIGLSRASDDTFLDINDAGLAMFGYAREELIGKSARELQVFASPVERTLAVEPLRTGQGVYNRTAQFRARNGRLLTALFSAVPVSVGDEPCILWLCVDVTEREQAQQRLRESQSLKTAIVDAAYDAIIAYDESARVVEWNAAATSMLGWERADAVGRVITDLIQTDLDAEPIADHLLSVSRGQIKARETRLLRRDGSTLDAELSLVVTRADDTPVRTIAIRDISLRRQLSRRQEEQQIELERRVRERTTELKRSNTQLRDANEMKNRFLATVSHELRTPLTAILGFSDLLRHPVSGVADPVHQRQITQVHDAAEDLLRLINDLLDVSRVESGRLSVRREAVDVVAAAGAVTSLLATEAERKGLRLLTVIDPLAAGMQVISDRQRVQQVLLNLVGNAVKFTTTGTVTVTVRRPDAGGVSIAVTDTGPGISASQLDELFKPFVSLAPDASAVAPGAGLGLYLVRRLLVLLGGRVDVRSLLGSGSEFTVWLPDASPADGAADMAFLLAS
jgi:PAS domain S-box-containing protein